MPRSPWFTLEPAAAPTRLRLEGAWRLEHLDAIERDLQAVPAAAIEEVEAGGLTQIDSSAALALLRALRRWGTGAQAPRWQGLDAAAGRIVSQVQAQLAATDARPSPPRSGLLARLGRQTVGIGSLLLGHLNFLGATAVATGELLTGRRGWRPRELSAQIQQTGLDAIPVVALVTALIGVVFTYLLGLQAGKYGANIFVVDGVAIGATREFAPIIVAIVVAGRSGASFTAQLGSMRLTEEIDAIQTLGLSPQQVLVLPRVLALMLTLPLLVFVGDLMSIVGSMLIAGPMLDIHAHAYLERLRDALDLKHVVVGLIKAPVFAAFIAIIGTHMGIAVERDTRAVGAATTSTVVQSIVAVILLDAAFAVLLQALGV